MKPQSYVPRYQDQPELARSIAQDPVFSALEDEVKHERRVQAMKWWYTYTLNDSILGQTSKPFTITIEQGTDFKCIGLTASVFSYDGTAEEDGSASKPSSFPIPNGGGNRFWGGRGLTMRITDTRSGRELTSGDCPFELFATPGYGLSFVSPFPFKYFFMRNSKVRFDIRNNDASNRAATQFSIALHGYKYLTPGA